MRILKLLLVLAMASLLGACSSPTTANKTNFTAAINKKLGCDPVLVPLTGPKTVVKVSAANRATIAQLNALARAGLLKVRTRIVSKRNPHSMCSPCDPNPYCNPPGSGLARPSAKNPGCFHGVTERIYSVTRSGSNAMHKALGLLCVGHEEVAAITSYTKPTAFLGKTVSSVRYTYHVTHLPAWAKSKEVESAFGLGELQSASTTLVLTNHGWAETR